jgi:hypothetical protein
MFKKVILYLSIGILSFLANGQITSVKPKLTLLYYFDDSKNAPFLLPFIDTYLKEMAYSNQKMDKVYSQVISLNGLNENRNIEGKIIDAFIYNDRNNTNLENSKPRDESSAAIAKSLLNYDKFLIIKSHPFNSLLEYQFLMYEVIKPSTELQKDIPILKNHRSSSVFIDPKSNNYKDELSFALKQVCSEVNESPKAEIKVNGERRKVNDTLFVAIDDTLKMEALTIDPDSPPERLSFTWQLNREELYPQLKFGKQVQKITTHEPLVVNVSLSVSDGISISDKKETVVSFIKRPLIELLNSGNAVFWDYFGGEMDNNTNDIRDDKSGDMSYDGEYLYRQSVFGRKRLLFGEDSLTIYFSKGNIRLANTSANDSTLKSTFRILNITKDTAFAGDTGADTVRLKKGNYAIFHLYPERELKTDRYYYCFYALHKGVKSDLLKVCLNFGKIRQLSISNEYFFCWLGPQKGNIGNALLGLNWQLFSYLNLSVHASLPFLPTNRVHTSTRDYLQTKNVINSRFTIQFINPNKLATSGLDFHLQQFTIKSADGTSKSEYLWGLAWRQSFPLFSLGTGLEIVGSYGYFPNFNKKVFLSNGGMFETSLGFRYHFIKRKKEE